MSNNNHKTELTNLVNELMTDIDSKPLHPRNNLLVYSRYVLSKLSWHFTIATLSKTWVIENIDPVVPLDVSVISIDLRGGTIQS